MKFIHVEQSFKDDGQSYYKGELRCVSEGKAGYFCGLGWARDADGEIETGAPDTSPKKLKVDNGKHKAAVTFTS